MKCLVQLHFLTVFLVYVIFENMRLELSWNHLLTLAAKSELKLWGGWWRDNVMTLTYQNQ